MVGHGQGRLSAGCLKMHHGWRGETALTPINANEELVWRIWYWFQGCSVGIELAVDGWSGQNGDQVGRKIELHQYPAAPGISKKNRGGGETESTR